MIPLIINYRTAPPVTLHVPDIGLPVQGWALAAYAVTNKLVDPLRTTVPGAAEVRAALLRTPAGDPPPAVRAGDIVEVGGQKVACTAPVTSVSLSPRFADLPPAHGPLMYVGPGEPPPDAVAYVEDARDVLWTGRGAGMWRCLTGGRTGHYAVSWDALWEEEGPLVPLVPVVLLEEADGAEWQPPHRPAGGPAVPSVWG